ncbi:polymorphic toxin type 23 domain-containing protein [Aureispira anguillae]|uniref:Polymorphic toxin type 23 domain-containing protein n=1 Tax=Aureispira anguillae TaxID=2864201 RepID=A0A916DTA4_9BACT|nr:polymorphic toxin type 23 domain-containing protein [Aureispira anguillae]BDS11622.1 polymorphic toxin type 23 domain-containing protein [Aureispira anguillae]
MKQFFLLLTICFTSTITTAQLNFAEGFGGQIGLSFNLGSHFNRIGLIAKLFYHYEHIQTNVQFSAYYNARTFPMGIPSWEGQLRLGLVATFGIKDSSYYSPFINEVSNQTSRPYSIGYSYNFYLDNVKTSQLTGTFGFGIYGFSLLMENDFLAFLQEDKHRTGAMGLYYRIKNTQIGLVNIAWTADPYGPKSKTMKSKQFPAKYGYRLMDGVLYQANSAGVLAVQVEQSLGYGQYLGASIGIDADQIRNTFQNKLIHDSFLLTDPHIPMIDLNGEQYLYQEGQEIRPARFFFQIIGNNTALY